MLKFTSYLLIIYLLISCNSGSGDEKKVSKDLEIAPKEKAKNLEKNDAPKTKKFPVLGDENLKDFLTAYGKENPENRVILRTKYGEIKIQLYEDTPLHRASFIMLIKRNYFEGTVFYRIINDFMIQGGNSDTWETQEKKASIGNYKIPHEISLKHIHKKGALATARNYTDNPKKMSSPYSFYIVQRGPIKPEGVTYIEEEKGITYSEEQRLQYINLGGTPSLDLEHTVFGEVIEGLDVVDKIAAVATDERDWPLDDIYLQFSIDE